MVKKKKKTEGITETQTYFAFLYRRREALLNVSQDDVHRVAYEYLEKPGSVALLGTQQLNLNEEWTVSQL